VISWYLAHRLRREAEILAAISSGARDAGEIVEIVYRDVDPALHPLARQSVLAHLQKLRREGRLDQDSDVGGR
jgi:gamma-glutamyl:cysteine ligase YbdK (ATP-grasp superfamily)